MMPLTSRENPVVGNQIQNLRTPMRSLLVTHPDYRKPHPTIKHPFPVLIVQHR